jgi:hypothetical protein
MRSGHSSIWGAKVATNLLNLSRCWVHNWIIQEVLLEGGTRRAKVCGVWIKVLIASQGSLHLQEVCGQLQREMWLASQHALISRIHGDHGVDKVSCG